MLIPFLSSSSPLPQESQRTDDKDADATEKHIDEAEIAEQALRDELERISGQERAVKSAQDTNSTDTASPILGTASSILGTATEKEGTVNENNEEDNVFFQESPSMTEDEQEGIFGSAFDERDIEEEADYTNLEASLSVSPIPTTRIHKDHPINQII